MTSKEAWDHGLFPKYLDFIYIDGDHSRAGVSYDLEIALLRADTVALHDYQQGGCDVTAVVDEAVAQGAVSILAQAGHLVVLKKGSE